MADGFLQLNGNDQYGWHLDSFSEFMARDFSSPDKSIDGLGTGGWDLTSHNIDYDEMYYNIQKRYKEQQDKYSMYGGAAEVGVGLLSTLRNMNMPSQLASKSIAEAKQTYNTNVNRLKFTHGLEEVKFLKANTKFIDGQIKIDQNFYDNLIKSQMKVNQAQAQRTQLTNQLAHQRFDTFHRLTGQQLSDIQGKVAISSSHVEEAKRQQMENKIDINYQKALGEHSLNAQKADLGIQKRVNNANYQFQLEDQRYAYNRQIQSIKEREAQLKQQQKSSLFGGIAGIVGGIAGFAMGGPVGASAGMGIGSSLGGFAGTL